MARAIVIATGGGAGLAGLSEQRPAALVPLLDRPFLQHVVETLVGAGLTRLEFVLSRFPEQIESHFGDGTRWGAAFRYHLVQDPACPFAAIRALDLEDDEELALADGHCLPVAPPAWAWRAAPLPAAADLWPAAVLVPANAAGATPAAPLFAGWLRCRGRWLKTKAPTLTLDAWAASVQDCLQAGAPHDAVGRPLSLASYAAYLESLARTLADESLPILRTGTANDAGVRLARNVTIHPTAELRPPVFVGRDCHLGPGVCLGPHVAVGANCFLDAHSSVEHAIILPGSYLGEGLEVRDSIIDRNRIINVRLGGQVDIADNFIIGAIEPERRRRTAGSCLLWWLALGLCLGLSPLFVATWLVRRLVARGPPLHRRQFVRLPASGPPAAWKLGVQRRFDFAAADRGGWTRFLGTTVPGLLSVVAGDLALVGLPPRTAAEIQALPEDWRQLYLSGKAGLFTETEAIYGAQAGPDERYACEAWYVAAHTFRHELWILARGLGLRRQPRQERETHDPPG